MLWILASLVAATLAAEEASVITTPACESGYVLHNITASLKKCYKFYSEPLNFDDARATCKNDTAILVSPQTTEEASQITYILRHQPPRYRRVAFYLRYAFIDFSLQEDEMWHDSLGRALSASLPWGEGEPNNDIAKKPEKTEINDDEKDAEKTEINDDKKEAEKTEINDDKKEAVKTEIHDDKKEAEKKREACLSIDRYGYLNDYYCNRPLVFLCEHDPK